MNINSLKQNTPEINWNPWREYVDAAWWCAARNLKGKIGDPLPELLSREALEFINEDPEAFESYVRMSAYALAMRRTLEAIANEPCDHGPTSLCPREAAERVLRETEK